jgi:hypothetical protein
MEPLKCDNCKKDILSSEEGGLLVFVQHNETSAIDDIYTSCDGECYDYLKDMRIGEMEFDNWRDIAELKNPILFLEFIIDTMDYLQNEGKFDEMTYEKLKTVILRTAQYIIRDITDKEKDEAIAYNMNKIK